MQTSGFAVGKFLHHFPKSYREIRTVWLLCIHACHSFFIAKRLDVLLGYPWVVTPCCLLSHFGLQCVCHISGGSRFLAADLLLSCCHLKSVTLASCLYSLCFLVEPYMELLTRFTSRWRHALILVLEQLDIYRTSLWFIV